MLSHIKSRILHWFAAYNKFISKNQWYTFFGLYVAGVIGVFLLWGVCKAVVYVLARMFFMV